MASCPFCLQAVDAEALSCSACRARLSRLCPSCGEEISSLAPTCKYCGGAAGEGTRARVAAVPSPAPAFEPPPAAPPGFPPPMTPPFEARPLPDHVPWEDPSMAMGSRFWQTCKGAMTAPGEFFGRLPMKGGHGAPVLFVFILVLGYSMIHLIVCVAPAFLAQEGLASFMEEQSKKKVDRAAMRANVIRGAVQQALQPVGALAFLYAFSGLAHVLAMAFGGKAPFEATLRAVAYAHGPLILAWIPLIGVCCTVYVGAIWALVLMCVAVGKAHGFGGGKGAGAVLLASIPFIGLYGIFVLYDVYKEMRNAERYDEETVPTRTRQERDEPEPPEPDDSMEPDRPPGGNVPAPPIPDSWRGQWLLDRPPSS